MTVIITDADGRTGSNTFPLHVSGLQMPDFPSQGRIGVPYSHTLRIIGGTGPYLTTQTGGQLPQGLTLTSATGLLSGTPAEGGSFDPRFTFADDNPEIRDVLKAAKEKVSRGQAKIGGSAFAKVLDDGRGWSRK